MRRAWSRAISAAELDDARTKMLTNMVAGDTLAIQWWRYTVLGCVAYSILRAAVYCIRHFRTVQNHSWEGAGPAYLYFTPSCEQAIRGIEREFPGSVVGFKGRDACNFPIRQLFLATIWCFRSPRIWGWIRADRRWRPWISDVIFYILTWRWAEIHFADKPPQTLIYSNDHCCFDRGIADAAARHGHTTVYVQHAAVTDIFPPLTAHFSLLDGQYALQTYLDIPGSSGTALVCGRQYELVAIRQSRHATRTALACASTIDSVESWRTVLKTIKQAGYEVFLRTHPSERKIPAWRRMAAEIGVQWLDPSENTLASSLERSSVVFAGQSGVLLEAALSGATAIIVQFDEDTERGLYDYFGFGARRVAHLTTPQDIAGVLRDIASGQELVSTTSLSAFDIAYSLDKNMQLSAIDCILRKTFDPHSFASAGFAQAAAHSNDRLTIYFPQHEVSD